MTTENPLVAQNLEIHFYIIIIIIITINIIIIIIIIISIIIIVLLLLLPAEGGLPDERNPAKNNQAKSALGIGYDLTFLWGGWRG